MIKIKNFTAASLIALALCSTSFGQLDLLPSIQKGNISINLNPIVTGLSAPDYGISAPGDSSRTFIVEQKGQILVLQNNAILPTPALNFSASTTVNLTNANNEQGLLGLAFHPDYNTPGASGFHTLYTYGSQPIPVGTTPTYSVPPTGNATNVYQNVINEWKISSTDPSIIDPLSRREVLSLGKSSTNHNGGTIAFGLDKLLYLGTGDGGGANDSGVGHLEPGGNAQSLTTALGKMLRIDPLNPILTAGTGEALSINNQYRIPVDNPFQAAGQLPEIYAYGLRNPYRFAFDNLPGGTNNLIAADVGQGNIEEIDLISIGKNYGWGQKEGDFLFNRVPGGAAGTGVRSPELVGSSFTDPISGVDGTLEYDHQDGISITGGFVYRGSGIPELFGKYVFGDLALVPGVRTDARLFYADLTSGSIKEFLLPQFAGGFLGNQTLHGFGQDGSGELYALAVAIGSPPGGTGGIIYSITAVPEPTSFLLLGAGAISLACQRRSRRRVDAVK